MRWAALLLIVGVTSTQLASAGTLVVSGKIDYVSDPLNAFSLSENDSWSLTLDFDETVSGVPDGLHMMTYNQQGAFDVLAGTKQFDLLQSCITVVAGSGVNSVSFRSDTNTVNGVGSSVQVVFEDDTATAFNGLAIPSSLDPSLYNYKDIEFTASDESQSSLVMGSIDSVTYHAQAVPEPSSLLAFGFLPLGWLLKRRSK